MNVKIFVAFWTCLTIFGVMYIISSGASYSSITCATGEIVKMKSECKECNTNLECESKGADFICDLSKFRCQARTCFSDGDCVDPQNVCEFNRCIKEIDLYDQIND